MIKSLLNKIIGDPNEKELKRIQSIVDQINQKETEYQSTLTKEKIPEKTTEFKQRLQQGETVDDLMVEAFALVKYACRQLNGDQWEVRGDEYTWENIVPYNVQLVGGIVLHEGKIAEMKTGEGKTLVSTFPIYLNALTEKGVHVVTVNDYLATRDAEWMGGLYRLLGLTVGIIQHGQSREEKKEAYNADITYGTNNEFGFDYLRDNMARRLEDKVQRPLHFSIVDEVDSILIDEARTPLIISAPAEQSTEKYQKYARLVGQLEENTHYNIDEKAKTALISEEGIKKMEQLLGLDNIYTEAGFEEVHHIEQALKAKTVYQRDTDYMIKDGQVIIVDEFTGRLMEGRRYGRGLHQAIEAKEGVEIKRESKTLATITFQNYFRLYEKLAGMTGTAITEAEEFASIYGLETLVIPTNRPIARHDKADVIYKNTQGKFGAIAKTVKELHEKGQPVLIGTVSVEKSETLSNLLSRANIPHKVLNAKHHEKEAEIVAKAGHRGAVTIATNMAGRGTDIKLGEGVRELGGLVVIGTERHESRRIDNQLRGRSGRQGDPGMTQFYVSMEDDLMRIFGSEKIQGVMDKLGVPDDMPIESGFISKQIESAQKKVEGRNFDIRKHLVEYDDVMNKHREIMYKKRDEVLEKEDLSEMVEELLKQEAARVVGMNAALETKEKWNHREIAETLSAIHADSENQITEEELKQYDDSENLTRVAHEFLKKEYETRKENMPSEEVAKRVEKLVSLRIIDTLWMQHIDDMSKLRQKVALRGYGQRDPLIEYKGEAFEMFTQLNQDITEKTVSTLFKVKVRSPEEQKQMIERAKAQMQNNVTVTSSAPLNATSSNGNVTVVNASTPTPGFTPNLEQKPAPENTVGRNDPCPCGSGKKFKKCCGKGD